MLAFNNRLATGGEIDIPRFVDLTRNSQKPEEKPEEIISRFDKLRRR